MAFVSSYDPATAQFLTRDPLEAATRSAYGYVGGNPLNGTDPSGLSTCGRPHGLLDQIGISIDCLLKGEVNVDAGAYLGVGVHVGVNINFRHPAETTLEGGAGFGFGGGASVSPGKTTRGNRLQGCYEAVCLSSGGPSVAGFGPRLGLSYSWDHESAPFKDAHLDCNPFTDSRCPWVPTPGVGSLPGFIAAFIGSSSDRALSGSAFC